MNYFSDESIDEKDRRDVAFQTVNAVRESVTLAKNNTLPVSYEFAMAVVNDLDSDIYSAVTKLLASRNENDTIKFYKEKAEIKSTDEKKILPYDLVVDELAEIDELLNNATEKKTTLLRKRKIELLDALEYFQPQNQSEHKILSHDFTLKSRGELWNKPLYENDDFVDYKINENRVLRLRLLHPDKYEAILGVDLIYEHFDLKYNQVRFAHMQYKTWDSKVLYASSSKNLLPQIEKMRTNLCLSNYCKGPDSIKDNNFRFPYCSGFLRPTDKIQDSQSKLISTGIHVPICQASKLLEEDKMISYSNSKELSVRGNIFEELFNSNIVGSRWIHFDDLENFYKEKNIPSFVNRIRIHAQAVDDVSDYEKNKNR